MTVRPLRWPAVGALGRAPMPESRLHRGGEAMTAKPTPGPRRHAGVASVREAGSAVPPGIPS